LEAFSHRFKKVVILFQNDGIGKGKGVEGASSNRKNSKPLKNVLKLYIKSIAK
jgi:hypothetical protein